MIQSEKLENIDFLKKSIEYLEAHGFEGIKTDLEGYELPKSYLKKGSEVTVTPDIVARKNGRKYYFDISLKSEKPKLLKSKWLFLDTLSRMNSNRFKIITTKGHYKFTDTMLDDINLSNKSLIKI
ncbi:hypothetical protein K8352_00550 [Flavobacteriaceae bacterium F89]|uniref:Uncharacterized protein n=1 Tax=Cerina litoralis TaxID=2874477 RepID=A0AAE3ES87_9FLAO|nr:hypothetical protein [Cerina litoralis]MCG2459229.1 hypothetical protein [Cerina litoralis]